MYAGCKAASKRHPNIASSTLMVGSCMVLGRPTEGQSMPDRNSSALSPRLFSSAPALDWRAFQREYALESAALFNPSIVPHPDQSGLEPGALRFIMSLRATGEGHSAWEKVDSVCLRRRCLGQAKLC
jgi:hypothetical protein